MFIISLPWNREKLEYLLETNDLFDLIMKNSTQQYYLIIQDNTVTWIGQGTMGFAYHIKCRTSTMNGSSSIPKDLGIVGFLGSYSGIEDAIHKLFPKSGYCASNMKFADYNGQRLKCKKDHYSVIQPILCLLGEQPDKDLQHFFEVLGWGNRIPFTCSGNWKYNMKLFIGDKQVESLEVWFTYFCSIALA